MCKFILVYHSISDNPKLDNFINTPLYIFKQQITYLLSKGFVPLHLEDLLKYKENGFLITIDDGLESSLQGISFLEENHIPYGISLIASKIGKKKFLSEKQLRQLKFVEFYAHSVNHLSLHRLDYNSSKYEILEGKSFLEKKLQQKISVFVYPYGEYHTKDIKILQNSDYKYGLSLLPFHLTMGMKKDDLLLPRVNINGNISWLKFKILTSFFGGIYLYLAYIKRKMLGQSYLKP